MNNFLLISDAAKEVRVESHVLRYWEEELHLPIKRNELGHRYYTVEDVERFKRIKSMKERGLQLKAIKMILKDGKLDVLPSEEVATTQLERATEPYMAIDIVGSRSGQEMLTDESKEEKAKRLQWLLQQLIRETLRENNQELCREIKESVVKELDYQFRNQEERDEERERRLEKRNEEYYKKMDELLRKKSRGRFTVSDKQEKSDAGKDEVGKKEAAKEERHAAEKQLASDKEAALTKGKDTLGKKVKKKRHSFF